ncbi:hypothetical protein OIDMADRAFT_20750 [Oidiodendron maius Zn]|uniref:Globin-sensor domain-containing protein n=1 Tax=Oidiodendron maius (strain Zn) TaxID=913774 RepID=A0A0C3D341_OIDMZ|nr:hypothetical protein OIDMADRAFT_20750 [Oidiodendron maius Zn]
MSKMQHIDEASLSGLPSRIAYLPSFLEVTSADSEMLMAAKPLIAPLVPTVLDAVYTKLLFYCITAKAFVPRNSNYEGETPKEASELSLDHPQIRQGPTMHSELSRKTHDNVQSLTHQPILDIPR